jgi:uncharacterized protein
MLWEPLDPRFSVAGLLVGALVGMTGIGGGSLMTPLLIVLFGVSPATAVGTDLMFAAITKTIGSLGHGLHRTIDWRIVGRMALGSIPATALALVLLSWLQLSAGGGRFAITTVLIAALVVTAVMLIARNRIRVRYGRSFSNLGDKQVTLLTIAAGMLLGIMVTFSSVGAGAIGVTALVLLYPAIPAARIVGSDIAHAVPLTLIAGLGYGAMGSVDPHMLISLLVGSLPGVLAGSLMSARIPELALRYTLAAVLVIVAAKLTFDTAVQLNHTRAVSGAQVGVISK